MSDSKTNVKTGLVVQESGTLTPSSIELNPAGGADSTTTVIQGSQTVDRTLTLPDATDTVAVLAATQTLTNKTIDADLNTITNIENADIKAGAAIDATKIADGSVTSTEFQYLAGVTSDIQTQIDSKAPSAGAVTETGVQTLTNKTIDADLNTITNIEDADIKLGAAISVSKIADGSVSNTEFQYLDGVTSSIQTQINAKADTTALTAHTSASAGVHGVTGSVVGTTDTQTLTNKTIGDSATFTQISTPANPAAGSNKLYVKADNKFYTLTSAGVEVEVGSGSGSAIYPVDVVTASNVSISAFVAPSNVFDNVTLVSGTSKVLVVAQTLPAENGVYVYNGNGSPLTRDVNWDAATEFTLGRPVYVRGSSVAGTASRKHQLYVVTVSPATVGTDPITFEMTGFDSNNTATLIPASNVTYDLGSSARRYSNVFASEANIGSVNLQAISGGVQAAYLVDDGSAVKLTATLPSRTLNLLTADTVTGSSKDVIVKSGDVGSAGTSGNVILTPGAGPTSGTVRHGNYIPGSATTDYRSILPIDYVDNLLKPNYVVNGTMESGVSQYVTYADAAGSAPVDGTGGSSNLIITASTSNPLNGSTSLVAAKPGFSVQGQGFAVPFTITKSAQARPQKISFDYIINAGTFVAGNPADRTAAGDSDVTVWLYDITNNVVVQPSTYRLYSNSSTVSAGFDAYFQPAYNASQYRLIFHYGTTSANNFEIKVDNVKVVASELVSGTPITDWQSYTPTFTGSVSNPNVGTTGTVTGMYRRVGGNMEGRFTVTANGTGVSPGSGVYRIGIVPGHTIDISKLPASALAAYQVGNANYLDSSATANALNMGLTVEGGILTGLMGRIGQSTTASAFQSTLTGVFDAATDIWFGTYSVPILGWSSSVQMSDSADTRVVDFVGYLNAAQSLTANVTNIPLVVTKDSHGAWNGSAYVIPTAGDYKFHGGIALTGQGAVRAWVNGVASQYISFGLANNINVGSTIIPNLKAGDSISFRADITTSNLPGQNFTMSIEKLSGPSAIAATETIAAVYTSSVAQSIGNDSFAVRMNYETKEIDTHGAVTTGATWTFTAPASGIYDVSATIRYAIPVSSAYSLQLVLLKNGTQIANGPLTSAATSSSFTNGGAGITRLVRLNAGETLSINAYQATGASRNTTALAVDNHVSIKRIGL